MTIPDINTKSTILMNQIGRIVDREDKCHAEIKKLKDLMRELRSKFDSVGNHNERELKSLSELEKEKALCEDNISKLDEERNRLELQYKKEGGDIRTLAETLFPHNNTMVELYQGQLSRLELNT